MRAASKRRCTLLGVVASRLKSTSLSVNHSKSFGGTAFAYSLSTWSLRTPKSCNGQRLPAHNSRRTSFLLPLKPELATCAGPKVRMRRSLAVLPFGLTSLVSHDRMWSAMVRLRNRWLVSGCWDGRQSVGAEEGQMGREQHQTVTSEGALEAALQAASYSALGLANHRGQYRGQYRGPHVRGL